MVKKKIQRKSEIYWGTTQKSVSTKATPDGCLALLRVTASHIRTTKNRSYSQLPSPLLSLLFRVNLRTSSPCILTPSADTVSIFCCFAIVLMNLMFFARLFYICRCVRIVSSPPLSPATISPRWPGYILCSRSLPSDDRIFCARGGP